MSKRVALVDKAGKAEGGGNYFATPKTDIEFISSGCKLLDLALGGGWAEGRIANVVGDKSTGKTLLAIEAAANFCMKYPKGKVYYREAEAAFDDSYAEALGMPMQRVDFGKGDIETIEDMFDDLDNILAKDKQPFLYILDSLDALSDRAELARDFDEGSYGTQKAKLLSKLFRTLTRRIADVQATVFIVSQVRDRIGMTFGGRTTKRSGGRALDFYASQVLHLAQMGTVYEVRTGVKRPVAIKVLGKVDKNKVGLPMRECEFQIRFGYGTNDALASLLWLDSVGSLKAAGVAKADMKAHAKRIMSGDLPQEELEAINAVVEERWYEIETTFLPTKRKYE